MVKLGILTCFWTTFFYSIALFSSYYKGNMTGLQDSVRAWQARPWVHIVWAQNECPPDYEVFGNLWEGTHPGNYT